MPDPAIQKSLVQLATIVKQLQKESESLNTTIAEFQDSLVAVNPGIALWSPILLRYDEVKLTGAQLGFAKHDDEWGLWIRRGTFSPEQGGYELIGSATYVRLIEASREERTAAVELFPDLVDALATVAQAHLDKLRLVNQKAK